MRVNLTMNAENLPDSVSRNTIINFRGSEMPDDFVVVSGHIDSWDVGAGAMDDGGVLTCGRCLQCYLATSPFRYILKLKKKLR